MINIWKVTSVKKGLKFYSNVNVFERSDMTMVA